LLITGLKKACLLNSGLLKGLNVYKDSCVYRSVADGLGVGYVSANELIARYKIDIKALDIVFF